MKANNRGMKAASMIWSAIREGGGEKNLGLIMRKMRDQRENGLSKATNKGKERKKEKEKEKKYFKVDLEFKNI